MSLSTMGNSTVAGVSDIERSAYETKISNLEKKLLSIHEGKKDVSD